MYQFPHWGYAIKISNTFYRELISNSAEDDFEKKLNALMESTIFKETSKMMVTPLMSTLEKHILPYGKMLINQGEEVRKLFFVADGKIFLWTSQKLSKSSALNQSSSLSMRHSTILKPMILPNLSYMGRRSCSERKLSIMTMWSFASWGSAISSEGRVILSWWRFSIACREREERGEIWALWWQFESQIIHHQCFNPILSLLDWREEVF